MAQVFQRSVRRIPGPLYVVQLRWNDYNYLEGKRWKIPVKNIPTHLRHGALSINYVTGLELSATEVVNAYPYGVNWSSQASAEVRVMALPTGKRARGVEEYLKEPPFVYVSGYNLRQLPTQGKPVAISSQPSPLLNGSVHTDAHVSLVAPNGFASYIRNALPYIGIDQVDVPTAEHEVHRLLAAGWRETLAMMRNL